MENSYGEKEGINGYLVMNDNYFDEYVMQVVVNKKYLQPKDLEIIERKEASLPYYSKETIE